ncbi:carbohydrate porin [Maricaulis sp.]|uniref:carbohydrate porin n=1 Tax=Maricaulis sp. TaxID=1486257 RepID=UPI003A92FE7F
MRRLMNAAALAGLTSICSPAFADDDLSSIRAEIDAMRSEYQSRISELEARLAEAESRAANAEATANSAQRAVAAAPAVVPAPRQTVAASRPARTGDNAFNPAISVVLNGQYTASSEDPDGVGMPGFALDEEAGRPERGFNLGESEVVLTANIDPTLYGNLTFALTPEGEVEVEEAYIQTTALGGGVTLRGGRLFSGVGYLNEVHGHNWSFSDQPLPYRAFLGGQYGDDGVQMRWLAPLDQYVEFGAELYKGDSFPAGGAANGGTGTQAVWVRTGGDIGDSSSWLASASYMNAEAEDREIDGSLFTGSETLGIVSFVYKWAPGGNRRDRNLTLSGEYFFDTMDGDYDAVAVNLDRSGWYAQGVYQFRRRWSAGLRYAAMSPDNVPAALAGSALDADGLDPWAVTALLEFDTSEFGRLRAQFTHDETGPIENDEFRLQYTVIYGPHSAHRY